MSVLRDSPSSFVGRDADLALIRARFAEGARLVTIVAAGGMGKTRVAVRFALQCDKRASFCDLTEARDAEGMAVVVAASVGIRVEPRADLGRTIANLERPLLVLDNVEHIAPAAAELVRAWMSAAPHACFLATSRVVLGVPGEHLVELDPLELPVRGASAEVVRAAPSVELFLRRAREVRPGFDVEESELDALADVVRGTDGIPLAIELAAARVRVLGLEQLRRRLAAPLSVLARGDGGRHASMRRTIASSLELLDGAQRTFLAACSIFRGGFTLEAAEEVAGDRSHATLAALDALVARSLLRAREADGEIRFAMFETIRELAAEELASDPAAFARVATAHAAHYAEVARASSPALGAELENLVAAHAHAMTSRPQDALSIALALSAVLVPRGQLRLCLTLLDRALEVAPPDAAALVARGIVARELGELARAKEDLARGLDLARASGDPALEALARVRFGELIEVTGETTEARAHFALGLERLACAPEGRPRTLREAEIRARLGHAYRREGDVGNADREIKRALLLYREADSDEDLTRVLYEAGVVALFRGAHAEARAHFEEAIAIARRLGLKQAEGALESGLGVLQQDSGDIRAALAHHASAVRLFRETGSRDREASALYYLGGALVERGLVTDGVAILASAFDVMTTVGMPRYQTLIAGCLAVAAADAGQSERAYEWLSRARAAISSCESERALQATLAIHEAHVAFEASDETEEHLERARALGAAHSNDDVRFALRLLEARTRPGVRAPAAALVIFSDGSAFRMPGAAAPIDLSKRAPLRRILLALATLRADAPGAALSVDEIVRAGWPDERMDEASAANRVRVGLATLRKLGLRDAIATVPGGYLLHPATAVMVVPAVQR